MIFEEMLCQIVVSLLCVVTSATEHSLAEQEPAKQRMLH